MITLEDINSLYHNYGTSLIYHTIDTSKISQNAYDNVNYDFCICGHSINGNVHTFTFKVENKNWCRWYYILDNEGNLIENEATYNNSTITLTIENKSSIQLVLWCLPYKDFEFKLMPYKLVSENCYTIDYSELNSQISYQILNLRTNEIEDYSFTAKKGIVDDLFYVYVNKIDYELNLESNLVMGKKNKVLFNTPTIDVDCNCKLRYLDETVEFSLSDGEFIIDLSDYNSKSLGISIELIENDTILGKTMKFNLPVNYVTVDNFSTLINEILAGSSIIRLTDSFELLDNIIVSHDLLLQCENHNINCSDYGFIIGADCVLKVIDGNFNEGNPVFTQLKNSTVDINNCTFSNAKNEKYNNLGSVISCDMDISSLQTFDDFTTNIINSTFKNNHNCILHGGNLTVDNCKLHNTDMTIIDINNPSFLYQTDGEAVITNSIFDIDYHEDTSFENENIMYAQSIFMCGITAIINNASYNDLSNDNNVNWSNSPYNNLSHIYCKYYYPAIEETVYSSPVIGKEDKAICYCVSGKDWIFKENVQITRESWNTQNEIRKIVWED